MSFIDYIREIQSDPNQAFKDKDDALSYYNQTLYEKINPALDKVVFLGGDLKNKVMALEVKTTPPGDGGVAYYVGPTSDGTRKGAFYLNLEKTSTFKRFETTSLVLHEGNPGE